MEFGNLDRCRQLSSR